MRVLNLFGDFWGEKFVDMDVEPKFTGFDTWHVPIFGALTSICLDYLATDSPSSERATHVFAKGIWPYPTDHRALGVQLDLSLPLASPCTYGPSQQPIGWIPQSPKGERQLAADQTLECTGCCFPEDDIRWARHALSRGKTCGDDLVATEMLQACDSADWNWAVAFNRRVGNSPPQEDIARIGADPVRGAFKIRLLSKRPAPKQFRYLRPIACCWRVPNSGARRSSRSSHPSTPAATRHT